LVTVWRYGAVAIWLQGKGSVIVSDRAFRRTRPWAVPLPDHKDAARSGKPATASQNPMAPVDRGGAE
jgi:hypothetical protein